MCFGQTQGLKSRKQVYHARGVLRLPRRDAQNPFSIVTLRVLRL